MEGGMARFRLTQSIVVGAVDYHGGEVVTDIQPPSVPGDRVWLGLSSAVMAPGMVPLDGAATTMKAASAFANEQVPNAILGVHSIG
jgi:hypothetical protein